MVSHKAALSRYKIFIDLQFISLNNNVKVFSSCVSMYEFLGVNTDENLVWNKLITNPRNNENSVLRVLTV